ncbi:ATP-binding protein [Streptosporangium carneum]|uniref:ATP-binding protein n=1 Tax=Streptosporangium carneum TaxID=47481 RepID=UPI0022F2B893|nr:ATP-binding protein [Streptosporangium carneum]
MASARRFVRDTATDWNVVAHVPEIAELLVSELVANAIAHNTAGVSRASAIRVTVGREKNLMTVDVHDSSTRIPRMRRAARLGTSGRGLGVVQALSHDWGWTLNPYGNSVWLQILAWP